MNKGKVLVITYYWPPSGGAGVQRALKFVKYFVRTGVEPVVLTVAPEKASYPVLDDSLFQDVPKGVKVITTSSFEPLRLLSGLSGGKHVPYGGFANANKSSLTQRMLRWIRGNVFIPDARVGWVPFAVRAAADIIRSEGITAVIISSPPHSSQLIGLKLKRRFPSLRWIADMRDPWTDIYYYKDLMHSAASAKRDTRLERQVLEQADEIVVVSEAIRRLFVRKLSGTDSGKVHVIPNGYDEEDFKEHIPSDPDRFTITYVGTMAEMYRPAVFFDALQQVVQAVSPAQIRFRFVGSAPWTLKKSIEDSPLAPFCEWYGHVPHGEAICYMQRATALLLVIPDAEGAEGILTGKLFEYLGAGRLIIGIGPPGGDAAAIIGGCHAGRMFGREEGEALRDWLISKVEDWKQGKMVYEGNENRIQYTRSHLAARVAELLEITPG